MKSAYPGITAAFAITILFSTWASAQKSSPIDTKATPETKALFRNLQKLSKEHTLFEHHNATEYGHGWYGDTDRSDAFVYMVGMDDYGDMGRDKYDLETAAKKLKIISDYAVKKGKLAAFTETGLESIPNPTWWTETLLKTMQMYKMQLAYVLVWRNDTRSPTHFYAPFPGQVSVPDFLKFYNDPYTLFEKDLNNIYKD